MALYKLEIPPDQQSYQGTRGNTVIAVTLDGGLPRVRADHLGAAHTIQVQWTVGPNGFRYLNAFFRKAAAEGSQPFNIDLVFDHPEFETYVAYFVPNTYNLVSTSGLTYVVGATLVIRPLVQNDDQETLDLGLYVAPEA